MNKSQPKLEHSTSIATVAVISAACLWGIGNAVNKLIELDGLSVAFYRMWIGVPVMWLARPSW